MSFHTRLDAIPGGVNEILAGLLRLSDITPFGIENDNLGRIGKTEHPLELWVFAEMVKSALAAPSLLVSGCGRPVSKVAVVGGSGGDYIPAALAAGADTLVSGRIGYHEMMAEPYRSRAFLYRGPGLPPAGRAYITGRRYH
jgi:putative NIF3 family GTP cyclohydrolase 1 type 2